MQRVHSTHCPAKIFALGENKGKAPFLALQCYRLHYLPIFRFFKLVTPTQQSRDDSVMQIIVTTSASIAENPLLCSPFVLVIWIECLCPPWQSVSRKRWNKAYMNLSRMLFRATILKKYSQLKIICYRYTFSIAVINSTPPELQYNFHYPLTSVYKRLQILINFWFIKKIPAQQSRDCFLMQASNKIIYS